MLSSFVNTINSELSKDENKEILKNLYTEHVYPYEYKIYLTVVFIFILLLFLCISQSVFLYNHIHNNYFIKSD
jgi:hypothetical protein